MLRYAFWRMMTAVPTLFVVVTLSFFMIRIAPGGPFDQERALDPVIRANLERTYHLDLPLVQQYGIYLKNLLHGDLGPSFTMPEFSVAELLHAGLPVSIRIGGLALLLALILGGAMGVIAALYRDGWADRAVVGFATAGSTIPTFVVAPLFQLVFALGLNWLPVGGWNDGAFHNLIGPVICLMLPQLAVVARLMRSSMIEALHTHHIRTARAMGLSEAAVVGRHALRSALLPVVSYAGPAAAALMTGSVVVETVFSIPGIGRYFVDAALNRDYTVVMGAVVVLAVFTILFNLIVDIAYTLVDPRVRYD
ncbi:ABC transporter permease [Tropicimonas sp. IMCC34043]|uniref:ABC transporter permease n=1 Tax=Tropicimonas sp. IMCC34043 TaxID=2248760 RepID=UPI000E237D2A|nr:ABC transporter permease subunit [Tropicimonas sp. IMCC34043]